ncbi:MAG: SpoIIE family protein phosphatase [Deltaproteobacteria bacterium]|nr:SpoIIE family protein phosphatase [Deltaproteobacteria bacterium]
MMKIFGNRGLAFKLNFLILGGVTLVIALILLLNYQASRKLLTDKIEENAYNLARATANRLDTRLEAAAKIPIQTAVALSTFTPDPAQLETLLRRQLEANPDIYGIAAAFAPDPDAATDSGTGLRSCYFIRPGDEIEERKINYDYRTQDWYQIPMILGRPLWSEPYFGQAGGIVMTSYSVPFYRRTADGKKHFAGIVCIDLSLNRLRNVVSSLKIGRTGYAFLITRNGTFVTHPRSDLIMNETIFSVAEAAHSPQIREIGRSMTAGETGFTAFRSLTTGKMNWMVYTPLKANGWSLGVLFPQHELMAALNRLNRKMLFLGVVGFFLIMLVIFVVSKQITTPLRALARATGKIAEGELDTPIPIPPGKDEVGRLALSFADMQKSLREYIENLKTTTAAKERIESELNIASEIQMGILPNIFPPFPNRTEFNLYATLKPAREVGGDLYDFFMLDDTHLCFSVGDVSGKGVPAALFMAITQTLVKTRSGFDPAAVLSQVNNDLARDNPSMMFVTLFLGILDLTTGELFYGNGGHNPPYRLSPGPSGSCSALPTTDGIALGVMEDFSFAGNRTKLEPGETLFIFTDGVTEAMNRAGELYDEERLEALLPQLSGLPPAEIAAAVIDDLGKFTDGADQTDDITMLVIRFNGRVDD